MFVYVLVYVLVCVRALGLHRMLPAGTGQDAYDKIKAGASLVEMYSRLSMEGPWCPPKIKIELRRLLQVVVKALCVCLVCVCVCARACVRVRACEFARLGEI